MTVYYIRHDEYDDRAKVLHGLAAIYGLRTYKLTAVEIEADMLPLVGPLLDNLAEQIITTLDGDPVRGEITYSVVQSGSLKTSTVSNPPAQLLKDVVTDPEPTRLVEKKPRKQIPMELCPECGKMAQMTKKGYCKLCAMRKAREAKKTPRPTLSPAGERDTEKKAAPVVRENPPGAPEIVFETTPVEMRQLHRHGAIKGKRLG